jgi:hypothetical protein
MRHVIRRSVFDSNSSTMHTCVIMTEDQYKKWESGKLYYYKYSAWLFDNLPKEKRPEVGCLYTQDEVISFYDLTKYKYDPSTYISANEEYSNSKDQFIKEMGDFIGYDDWFDDEYLEMDNEKYITPNGERIIVCCKYGNDY